MQTHVYGAVAGRYQISAMAASLVQLINRSLADACGSGSAAVVQLALGAVRDVAALLIALPPAIRARELQVRPGTG